MIIDYSQKYICDKIKFSPALQSQLQH